MVGCHAQAKGGLTQQVYESLGFDLRFLRNLEHDLSAHNIHCRNSESARHGLEANHIKEILGLEGEGDICDVLLAGFRAFIGDLGGFDADETDHPATAAGDEK